MSKYIGFIGASGVGKTTIIGRILEELNFISEDLRKEAVEEAKMLGERYHYRLYIDEGLQEKRGKLTEELKLIKIPQWHAYLVDIPGKLSRIDHLSTALMFLDTAIIVGNYESFNQKADYYKATLTLAKKLKIKTICINISDKHKAIPDYVEANVEKCIATNIENVKEIVDTISNSLKVQSSRPTGKDRLIMPILKVIGEIGILETIPIKGLLESGMEVIVNPILKIGYINTIEHYGQVYKKIGREYVAVTLRKVGRQFIKRGYVITDSLHIPPRVGVVRVNLLYQDKRISEKRRVIICIGSMKTSASVKHVGNMEIELTLDEPLTATLFDEEDILGFALLTDYRRILGAGIIADIKVPKVLS